MSSIALAVSGSIAVLAVVVVPFGSGVVLLSLDFVGVVIFSLVFVGAASCAGLSFAALESGWAMGAFAWSEAAADSLSLLRMLPVSSPLFDSNRVRSAFLDRNVSP